MNVQEVGVKGAKSFFEEKGKDVSAEMAAKDAAYREEVKKKNEEKKVSQAAFKEKFSQFEKQ